MGLTQTGSHWDRHRQWDRHRHIMGHRQIHNGTDTDRYAMEQTQTMEQTRTHNGTDTDSHTMGQTDTQWDRHGQRQTDRQTERDVYRHKRLDGHTAGAVGVTDNISTTEQSADYFSPSSVQVRIMFLIFRVFLIAKPPRRAVLEFSGNVCTHQAPDQKKCLSEYYRGVQTFSPPLVLGGVHS